jgi:sugar lactone lactonase YvrE
VAESDGACLTAFTVGPGGRLTGQHIFARMGQHRPDGICLDADGQVWTACLTSQCCLRVNRLGQITASVHVDSYPLACALGGEDGRTLIMTTTTELGPPEANRSGRIETTRVGVPAPEWASASAPLA